MGRVKYVVGHVSVTRIKWGSKTARKKALLWF